MAIDRFSGQAAERVIRERGESLPTERKRHAPLGERGNTFLYLPDAILKGKPRPPLSVRPLHAAVFTLPSAPFSGFGGRVCPCSVRSSRSRRSHPGSRSSSVYGSKNVFGSPITILEPPAPGVSPLLAAAVAGPVPAGLTGGRDRRLVAMIGQARSEPATIIVSALLACVSLTGACASARLALAATVLGAFFAAPTACAAWFDVEFAQGEERRGAAGGTR